MRCSRTFGALDVWQLKMTARTIGAVPIGTLFTGLVAKEPYQALPEKALKRIQKLATKLL